jgi:hypothetical protein
VEIVWRTSRGSPHPPRRLTGRWLPRTARLTRGMRWTVPVHEHPQHRHEHHPEDHLPDQTPLLVTDLPPDGSARPDQDQDQDNRHALIVAAVAQPCKPRLGPWACPKEPASAWHDSPFSSGRAQARQPLTMTTGGGRAGRRPAPRSLTTPALSQAPRTSTNRTAGTDTLQDSNI